MVVTTTPTASTFTILGNQVGSSDVIVQGFAGATVTVVAVNGGNIGTVVHDFIASITIAAAGTVNYVAVVVQRRIQFPQM